LQDRHFLVSIRGDPSGIGNASGMGDAGGIGDAAGIGDGGGITERAGGIRGGGLMGLAAIVASLQWLAGKDNVPSIHEYNF
jgi:hypothetical protein